MKNRLHVIQKKDVEEWIEFLLSGLQPNKRPSSLKKSIPYTIPEDEESVMQVENSFPIILPLKARMEKNGQ